MGALKETLDDEMQWLCSQPQRLWDRVGEAAGVPGEELRSASIHAALVSVAHIRENVIRVVESPPWSLAIGDVKANLAELATKPEPADLTTFKVWVAAVKLGPTPELVEALTLVKDLSHVIKIAESQHARVGLIKKFHPEYHLMTLLARSIVSMLNLLLPLKTAEEKMVEKLEARFKQLRKKHLVKSDGRELYMCRTSSRRAPRGCCDVQSLLIFIRTFFGLIANPGRKEQFWSAGVTRGGR